MLLTKLCLNVRHLEVCFPSNQRGYLNGEIVVLQNDTLIANGGFETIIGEGHIVLHINDFLVVNVDLAEHRGRGIIHVYETSFGTSSYVKEGQRPLTIGLRT